MEQEKEKYRSDRKENIEKMGPKLQLLLHISVPFRKPPFHRNLTSSGLGS
jgi:hypothetical protein